MTVTKILVPGRDEANPQDRILAFSHYFSVTSISRSAIVTRTPAAPLSPPPELREP